MDKYELFDQIPNDTFLMRNNLVTYIYISTNIAYWCFDTTFNYDVKVNFHPKTDLFYIKAPKFINIQT